MRKFCVATCGAAVPESPSSRRRLKLGDTLFAKGDAQRSLFAVRAGFLKTCAVLPSGERRILGYHIMGDILGLDAIGSGVHPTEATALNSCEVCEISLDRVERLTAGGNELAAHLRGLLSEQIAVGEEHMVALGAFSARQRVASFLLALSSRWAARGYPPDEFDLCLTRREVGSYLGLTFETVSRSLSYFDGREWISVAGRGIRILDRAALQLQSAQA